MQKIFLALGLLVVLGSCAAPPTTPEPLHASSFITDPNAPPLSLTDYVYDPSAPAVRASGFIYLQKTIK